MAIDLHIQQAFANPEADTVVRDCLEVSHSLFVSPLRIVNDYAPFMDGSTAYAPYPFTYVLPSLEVNGIPQGVFKISNVSRVVSTKLLAALSSETEAISLAFRQFISLGATTYVYTFPLPMTVNHFSEEGEFVTLTASYHDLYNLPFLSEIYSAARFPGLQ